MLFGKGFPSFGIGLGLFGTAIGGAGAGGGGVVAGGGGGGGGGGGADVGTAGCGGGGGGGVVDGAVLVDNCKLGGTVEAGVFEANGAEGADDTPLRIDKRAEGVMTSIEVG